EVARFAADKGEIDGAAFSPDGRLLAYGCQDSTILLREAATGKIVQRFRGNLRSARLAFSPDGRTLASAATAQAAEPGPGAICLWEVATGGSRGQSPVADGRAYSLTFSADGLTLALGSGDQRIYRWDLAAGRELAPLAGHLGAVTSLAFSLDGRSL